MIKIVKYAKTFNNRDFPWINNHFFIISPRAILVGKVVIRQPHKLKKPGSIPGRVIK